MLETPEEKTRREAAAALAASPPAKPPSKEPEKIVAKTDKDKSPAPAKSDPEQKEEAKDKHASIGILAPLMENADKLYEPHKKNIEKWQDRILGPLGGLAAKVHDKYEEKIKSPFVNKVKELGSRAFNALEKRFKGDESAPDDKTPKNASSSSKPAAPSASAPGSPVSAPGARPAAAASANPASGAPLSAAAPAASVNPPSLSSPSASSSKPAAVASSQLEQRLADIKSSSRPVAELSAAPDTPNPNKEGGALVNRFPAANSSPKVSDAPAAAVERDAAAKLN